MFFGDWTGRLNLSSQHGFVLWHKNTSNSRGLRLDFPMNHFHTNLTPVLNRKIKFVSRKTLWMWRSGMCGCEQIRSSGRVQHKIDENSNNECICIHQCLKCFKNIFFSLSKVYSSDPFFPPNTKHTLDIILNCYTRTLMARLLLMDHWIGIQIPQRCLNKQNIETFALQMYDQHIKAEWLHCALSYDVKYWGVMHLLLADNWFWLI